MYRLEIMSTKVMFSIIC